MRLRLSAAGRAAGSAKTVNGALIITEDDSERKNKIMKKLSILLAIVMMISMVSIPTFAETTEPTETEILSQNCEFAMIEADGAQPRLTYIEGVTNIIEVDGLKFKDMNGNGQLDVYEDYRRDIDERVADLVSQMTDEEKVGTVFCCSAALDTARQWVGEFKNTHMLFNLNGTPVEVVNTLNNIQAAAENERLSIPMTFTSDREYNAFGGYIDKSHEAFGTAYDPDLAYQLAYIYGKAMVAIGVHVTFEPYAEEIGAQYGENPELIAKVVHSEIKGLEDSGFASCTKHWIGRGGDSSFGNARSVAQNFDNWMVGWNAALSGGSEWVMTNCAGSGITNTCDPKWDAVTMSYLRDTIGFDGIVVTDWWGLGFQNKGTGMTPDGIVLEDQSAAWLYNDAMKKGTDLWGGGTLRHGSTDEEIDNYMHLWPEVMLQGVKDGVVEMDVLERSVSRLLKFKFAKGSFENPYRVGEEALAVVASAEYAANPGEIHSNEDLRAARNPEEVALTEKLQAESAVLVKNDGNLLPLQKGIKVYVESSNSDAKAGYDKYIAEYATVVETMEEADVVVGDFASINDVTELFVDDAKDTGKPIVLTLNNVDPTLYTIQSADALLYLSYNHKADHGSTEAGFITTTEPWVYTDLLFGEVQPGGVIVKEIARDGYSDAAQWKDLAGDQGASPYVRLMVQATMEDDKEYHASPNNWGDPLVQALYGMSYGADPEFVYSCLILPISQEEIEAENSRGVMEKSVVNTVTAKAGEPFTIYALLRNNGGDGITTVQVKDGDNVIAEKVMTVTGGSWRVVEMDVTLEAGEHTITLGDQVGSITVTE